MRCFSACTDAAPYDFEILRALLHDARAPKIATPFRKTPKALDSYFALTQ